MQLRLPWARGPSNPTNREDGNEEIIENENLREIPAYGDKIGPKIDGLVRIGFQNVNGITKSNELVGMEELETIQEMHFDLTGMVETNINWTHDARNHFHTAAGLRFNNTARCVIRGKMEKKATSLEEQR
eukprot:scaffold139228_cov59-Cyclotella_meneghiniana.AAC.4